MTNKNLTIELSNAIMFAHRNAADAVFELTQDNKVFGTIDVSKVAEGQSNNEIKLFIARRLEVANPDKSLNWQIQGQDLVAC